MPANPKDTFSYFENGTINPELVTTFAKKWADRFAPDKNKQPDSGVIQKSINSAQLRRFYGDVKNLEMRWQNSSDKEKTFHEILPMIKLLKAKAAYAHGRQLVQTNFRDWIWENVDMINTEDDFRAFLLYFEAVVGFCYGNGLKD